MRTSPVRPRTLALAATAASAALVAVPIGAAPAGAAAAALCNQSGFAVTVNGTTYSGGDDKRRIDDLPAGSKIAVSGKFVDFTVDADTFTIVDYRLTSSLSQGREVQVFASKRPEGARLSGTLDLLLADDHVRLQRDGNVAMKVQAKDCEEGGVFQLEPDSPITMVHQLGVGDGARRFVYPAGQGGTGSLCFTDRTSVPGYDSPQLATRTSYDPATGTSRWSVAAGGRMGMVVGGDARANGCSV